MQKWANEKYKQMISVFGELWWLPTPSSEAHSSTVVAGEGSTSLVPSSSSAVISSHIICCAKTCSSIPQWDMSLLPFKCVPLKGVWIHAELQEGGSDMIFNSLFFGLPLSDCQLPPPRTAAPFAPVSLAAAALHDRSNTVVSERLAAPRTEV